MLQYLASFLFGLISSLILARHRDDLFFLATARLNGPGYQLDSLQFARYDVIVGLRNTAIYHRPENVQIGRLEERSKNNSGDSIMELFLFDTLSLDNKTVQDGSEAGTTLLYPSVSLIVSQMYQLVFLITITEPVVQLWSWRMSGGFVYPAM